MLRRYRSLKLYALKPISFCLAPFPIPLTYFRLKAHLDNTKKNFKDNCVFVYERKTTLSIKFVRIELLYNDDSSDIYSIDIHNNVLVTSVISGTISFTTDYNI